MTDQPIPWREMLAVLHRRRKFILQVFLGGFLTVALGVWTKEPMYRAAATLMITSDRAQIIVSPDANTRPTVERVTEQDMNSEVALIRSEALVREVLEPYWNESEQEKVGILGRIGAVLTFPFRLPSILYHKLHGVEPASGLDTWVQATIQSNLGVSLVGKSNLIEVSSYAADPVWAAEFVNKLVARHLERRAKLSQQKEARRFFESQRDVLAEKSREAEAALTAFNRREGMESMDKEQRQSTRVRLEQLQTQLATSETELAEATARVQFLTNEIKSYPKNIATESKIAQNQQFIKPKILELELQRSELLAKYAPGSIKVRDIDRQIAEARRLMARNPETLAETTNAINPAYQNLEVDLAQTKAQMAAVGARVEALRSQVADHRTQVGHLDEVGSEQERLEQSVASAKEAFITYSKKEEEARFTTALDESSFVDLAVAEPAKVPTTPEKSKQMIMLILGSAMSLVAGVALAFLRDRLDPAVKSAAEAKNVTGLPILAEVR
jgi:succinoglycan biosynthesis transport protein ExoP